MFTSAAGQQFRQLDSFVESGPPQARLYVISISPKCSIALEILCSVHPLIKKYNAFLHEYFFAIVHVYCWKTNGLFCAKKLPLGLNGHFI